MLLNYWSDQRVESLTARYTRVTVFMSTQFIHYAGNARGTVKANLGQDRMYSVRDIDRLRRVLVKAINTDFGTRGFPIVSN